MVKVLRRNGSSGILCIPWNCVAKDTQAEVRCVVKSSWRVLYFLSKHRVEFPHMSRAYAEKEHAAFERLQEVIQDY